MKKIDFCFTSLPLFENMKQEDILAVLHCLDARTEEYSKGAYICMEGDPADFIGIVLAGTIQILRHDYDGNRSITASVTAGQIFGEAFACAELPKLPADIFAASPVTVMFLNKQNIIHQCKNACSFHSQLIQNLMKLLAQKNILLNRKLHYISRKTTTEKLMAYLKDQAKEHRSLEFTIPYNRQELADYLGVERSAMSAEISKLQKEGVLETNRSHFRLLS